MFDLILEAATIQDIYQKYYSNIPQDIFQEIISADPTYNTEKPNKMGKYGKWLLGIYLKGNLKTEDLYKVTDYLSYFVKYYNRIENKDINKISDLPSLFNVIRPFKEAEDNGEEMATSKSDEIRKIKEDAEFYKVDNRVRKVWEVTIYYDYYKYDYPERYVYYVDATTGEIIGGSRWNGAKRQISQLIEDPHNLIEK